MSQDRFKFRAWDVEKKSMYYINSFNCNWNHPGELIIKKTNILMQCTGLKDSEGKHIYEGDMVEVFLNKNHPTPYNCTIVFKGMGFWFMDEDEELFVFHPETYHITVVGNIYETKQKAE